MQVRLLMIPFLFAISASGDVIAPNLGTAGSFGLLGGTISNTGTSTVNGNVGATTTVTGFPPGTATGSVLTGGSTVAQAYSDFLAAYNAAFSDVGTASFADLTTDQTFIGNNVYRTTVTDLVSTAGITLTFDAQNNSSDVFIIEVNRDLTINGPLNVSLVNGAQAANIYWIVERTAVISPVGPPITFDGDILAGTSFTESANSGGSGVLSATINGCVFVETANTLAGETQVNGCGTPATAPEPGSAGLMALGCLVVAFIGWRRFRPIAKAAA